MSKACWGQTTHTKAKPVTKHSRVHTTEFYSAPPHSLNPTFSHCLFGCLVLFRFLFHLIFKAIRRSNWPWWFFSEGRTMRTLRPLSSNRGTSVGMRNTH